MLQDEHLNGSIQEEQRSIPTVVEVPQGISKVDMLVCTLGAFAVAAAFPDFFLALGDSRFSSRAVPASSSREASKAMACSVLACIARAF